MTNIVCRSVTAIRCGIAIATIASFATPATAQPPVVDPLTAKALQAFRDVCLAHAGSLSAARIAATAAPWNFVRGVDLPGYGKTMQTYSADGIDLVLRTDKKGFGCLVTYQLADATTADSVADAVGALPGLALKSPGKGKTYRATWTPAAPVPPGSSVLLTIYGAMAPRAPIFDLESKGSPD